MLAYLASAAVFALGPNAIVLTYAATTALFATGFIVAVHANSTPFAFFTLRSNSTVRTNTAALALFATTRKAVVNAINTGRRALPAAVLDFVVRADVWPLALPAHRVTATNQTHDGQWHIALNTPADPPAPVVLAENAAAAITALHLELAMTAPSAASAYFAGRLQRAMLTNTRALALNTGILRSSMDAYRAAAAVAAM